MGTFVLGVLVGWLAEWLFFTFVIKGKQSQAEDCSSLRSELETKKRLIRKLEIDLKDAKESAKAETPAQTLKKNISNVSTSKSKPAKKPATKTKTASATKKKAPAKKAPAKKTTAKKATTKTKASAKKPTAKTTKASPKKGDDFTKLSGIGPSMSATLKELGIDTFTKLAETDDDILRDMLEASGARMNNNKEVMDSWNEQATLAAKGEFAELKKMQEALKK